MLGRTTILTTLLLVLFCPVFSQDTIDKSNLSIHFYGDTILLPFTGGPKFDITYPSIISAPQTVYNLISTSTVDPFIPKMLTYKKEKQLDDWLYYQLVRAVAEEICPKKSSYHLYTLYKCLLLNKSGYNAITRTRKDTMLLYVQSNEMVYDIPSINLNGNQYNCLNYHDYGSINFAEGEFTVATYFKLDSNIPFSYKINSLPNFNLSDYTVKKFNFEYHQKDYEFKIMVNQAVKKIFTNYPTVEYTMQFSVPLSNYTYQSLIPVLKKTVASMTQQKGVDYLMRLTRSAFAFEKDATLYGKEKRLSPEQTLLFDYSDCEDRAAFFFYLVKEIYNLPMIVLSYPEHISVAIQFSRPLANPVRYNGNDYWVCEPTPQYKDLKIGHCLPSLKKQAFEVVVEYNPVKK